VTSGWHMEEFDMYGIDKLDHAARYARSAEFIQVLRGAWQHAEFDFAGAFYQCDHLNLEPRPEGILEVFQGGQSDDAIGLAAANSDWMFINGGSPERITTLIEKVRSACKQTGREVRFAMYAAPLCRATDDEAWAEIDRRLEHVDPELVKARQARLAQGAQGMWSNQEDSLALLDSNEGYAPRLIGSPDTILERVKLFHSIGIDMLHLDLRDELFQSEVLPEISAL